tara:strand:- start:437 stop:967 length:531 start_codon:yes stop_codon:yes gene_type:complete
MTEQERVERVAKAIAKDEYPESRWPDNAQDTIEDWCGVFPVSWDYAQKCRKQARAAIAALTPTPQEGDTTCQECGRDNPVWFAPNDVWNRVVGERGTVRVLCPCCFMAKGDDGKVVWEVRPEGSSTPQEAAKVLINHLHGSPALTGLIEGTVNEQGLFQGLEAMVVVFNTQEDSHE